MYRDIKYFKIHAEEGIAKFKAGNCGLVLGLANECKLIYNYFFLITVLIWL